MEPRGMCIEQEQVRVSVCLGFSVFGLIWPLGPNLFDMPSLLIYRLLGDNVHILPRLEVKLCA